MIYTRTQEVFKRLFDMKNGSNSRVVLERQKEVSRLESEVEKILEEVDAATRESANLQSTLKAVTKQYENLKELIKGKKTNDYEEINRELQISFDPTALRKELDEKYPNKKQELTEKIATYDNEVKTKNEEVAKLKSEVEEKSLQMSTILEKQKEMVELLKKSVAGDLLNFSPRPIIDTLKFLNFNDEEAKMLASNLIFSNPDFVNYYNTVEENEKARVLREKEEKEEAKEVVIEPTQKEEVVVTPVIEEPEEDEVTIPVETTPVETSPMEFPTDEVIDVFKVDNSQNKELLKNELNATDEDIEEYSEVLEGNVLDKINKLKDNNIDVKAISLVTLTNVDNFLANVKTLRESGEVSSDDLVKYSAKLTMLSNAKLEKYVREYNVVYRYPQGNLFLGVFDINENIVEANSKGLNKVDPKFFLQYPQFQVSNCDAIADVIHTCKVNDLEYQDEDGNYYMFVFDTNEFKNTYPDVNIISYKGLGE